MDDPNIDVKILIIDDNIITSSILEHLLCNEGFCTTVANNGLDGRLTAESIKPDIILLDMIMPGENGLETCRRLQESHLTSHIPIIFITSVQETGSKLAGFNAGAVDYIIKPFDRSEVLARIRVHLQQSRARRLLIQSHIAELKQLSDAQKSLGPSPENIPEAHYAIYYNSLHGAGGDFYGVVNVAHGVHDYVVADVSGHNIGSSIATGALKAILHQSQLLLYSPREAVILVGEIIGSVLREDQFVTLVYARLNRVTNMLHVVNAGHPPCIVAKHNGKYEILYDHGDLLGIFPHPRLVTQEIQISPGDRVFLYTDGFLDNYDLISLEESPINPLAQSCCDSLCIPLSEAISHIRDLAFPDSIQPKDDLLMLAIEV